MNVMSASQSLANTERGKHALLIRLNMSDLSTVRAFPLRPRGFPTPAATATTAGAGTSFGGGFARRGSDVAFLFLAGETALLVPVEAGEFVFEAVGGRMWLAACASMVEREFFLDIQFLVPVVDVFVPRWGEGVESGWLS